MANTIKKEVKSAFDGKISTYELRIGKNTIDDVTKEDIIKLLEEEVVKHGQVVVQLTIEVSFLNPETNVTYKDCFEPKTTQVFEKADDTNNWYEKLDLMCKEINKKLEKNKKDNYKLQSIEKLDVTCIDMTKSPKFLQFENVACETRLPLIVLLKFQELREKCADDPQKVEHHPIGFGYYLKCEDDNFSKYGSYQNDCTKKFWEILQDEVIQLLQKMKKNVIGQNIPIIIHNFNKYACCFVLRGLRRGDQVDEICGKPMEIKSLIKTTQEGANLVCRDFDSFVEGTLADLADNLNRDVPVTRKFIGEDLDAMLDKRLSDKEDCGALDNFSNKQLQMDVLLMADIFIKFRELSWANYELDPAHYISIAAFSWDAMLKYRKEKEEEPIPLLEDSKITNFFGSGIRGGLIECFHRHAKANKPGMADFDEHKAITSIVAIDANNAYGWAMAKHLPFSDFRWLTQEEIKEKFPDESSIKNLNQNEEFGYSFQVDLEYPKNLHNHHNDLPFCCESKEGCLVNNLSNKTDYIVLDTNLQLYLNHGLKLTTIHKVLRYRKKDWLKSYMYKNTNLRKSAQNDFEKSIYKNMNNVISGKTHQKGRPKLKLLSQWDSEAIDALSSLNLHKLTIINEGVVLLSEIKPSEPYKIKLCPSAFAIMELSKTLLYKVHYEYMQPVYGGKQKLLYCNTDSLFYEVETEDFYNDVITNPKSSVYFDLSGNKDKKPEEILGKMRDEVEGLVILEYYGVGPKAYYLDFKHDNQSRTDGNLKKTKLIEKGCKIRADGNLNHETKAKLKKVDYKKSIFKNKPTEIEDPVIVTKDFRVFTTRRNKTVLRPNAKKRAILVDKISTMAWDHKDIKKQKLMSK